LSQELNRELARTAVKRVMTIFFMISPV